MAHGTATSLSTTAALLALLVASAQAQLAGHGGPVRAIAISGDGNSLLSGSFDTAAIRWSLKTESAEQVLRFHSGAVNAVAFLKDGRMVTAGADAKVAIWTLGRQQPDQVFEGHTAPVVSLAISPDGARLASASWDHTVRVWSLDDGAQQVLEGHTQQVNGVAFTPDGRYLASVGYDRELRIWPLAGGTPNVIALESPLNAAAAAPDGEIVAGGADGKLHFLTTEGHESGEVQAGQRPIVALAVSPDGTSVAAAGIGGSVALIDRKARTIAQTLADSGSPVWAVAFLPDSATLLTGGADGKIRRWNARTGAVIGASQAQPSDPLAGYAGDHGAEVFRACVACHTLSGKDAQRAGPTLAGLYGRRIASLPGYRFSDALKGMNIIWTPETVSKLFELGPNTYTPGTKMPEQRIGSAEDRKALTDFLGRATSK
ncbi:c-type cytochrome [Bradyrhizobium acaciae]|uniref:c-type cytochrome n=1 Tax=Bradyrhizobium acaciae TaxID=2683706 RepID=UPI001E60AD31|nr:c-type cytochrome [Bradyrhizobium acaciae]MCC8977372.1 c-type cytochrome [Bradyrhizobium acaciae]